MVIEIKQLQRTVAKEKKAQCITKRTVLRYARACRHLQTTLMWKDFILSTEEKGNEHTDADKTKPMSVPWTYLKLLETKKIGAESLPWKTVSQLWEIENLDGEIKKKTDEKAQKKNE